MTEAVPFASLYVALPTPMDERGQIDEPNLDLIVDYLMQRSIDGLALLTEAAEDALLTFDEKKKLVERIASRVKGKKPMLVSISDASTRAAVDLARIAEKKGAAALLMSPLKVPGLDYRALYRHFDRVARAVACPLFVTIRPENAIEALAPEELQTFGEHARLTGVFLPQGSSEQIQSWAKRMKERAGPVLTGCSLAFSGAAKAGATGTICGLAMLATDQAVELMGAIKASDAKKIKSIEKKAQPAVEMLGPPRLLEELDGVKKLAAKLANRNLAGAMPPLVPFAHVKEGLRLQGHKLKSFVRPPYEAVTPEQSEKLKGVMKSSGLLT
jgi:dihydrodipicolinate synthase/N-acetylneuraminate lyase